MGSKIDENNPPSRLKCFQFVFLPNQQCKNYMREWQKSMRRHLLLLSRRWMVNFVDSGAEFSSLGWSMGLSIFKGLALSYIRVLASVFLPYHPGCKETWPCIACQICHHPLCSTATYVRLWSSAYNNFWIVSHLYIKNCRISIVLVVDLLHRKYPRVKYWHLTLKE